MVETVDTKAIKDLADQLRSLNKMDMFPRTQDDQNFDVLAKKLDDIEKGNRSETSRMIKAYDKALKEGGIKSEIKDLKDVFQAQDTSKAMKSILTTLTSGDKKDGSKLTYKSFHQAEQVMKSLRRQAESAGTTLEAMGVQTTRFYNVKFKKWEVRIDNHDKIVERLTKDSEKLSDALDEATHSTEKFDKRVNFVKNMLGKVGNVAKTLGKDFLRLAEQEQRFAQQNATADAGWIEGVKRMQISTLDYMKILKDTRRESLAMKSAGLDFKESLEAGADALRGFTFDSTEAAKVSAMFHKNVASMGVAQGDLKGAVAEQTKLYKDHYRVMGYSAEEFANLTTELLNDQGIRSQLLNLQEKERKQYIMGIQQRQIEYQTMGFTIERAKELQKTFAALNTMNPKERMKQAAKTRAMMGAMGMGAEGEELFNLQVQYRTMNAEQKKSADLKMTRIQQKAAGKFGAMSGSGQSIGQAMSMQMMAEKTGFLKISDTFETESGKGRKIDDKQFEIMRKKTFEISDTSKTLLHVQDTWRAAQNTALSSIATNLLSGFSNLAIINAAGFTATALASTMAGQGMPGMGGAGGPGKLLKGAGLVAAAGIGWEIGNMIGDKITGAWSGTESYGSFSTGLGKFTDFVAGIFSEDHEERLNKVYAAEKFQESLRTSTEKQTEVLERQNELIAQQTQQARETAEQQVKSTEKATQQSKESDRQKAMDNTSRGAS